ncbi:MAG: PEP-CTERM sorting domain-containing protein [Rubrivivax sp.]
MTLHKTQKRHARSLGAGLALLAVTSASLAAEPVFFGPSAYLSPADIPAGFYQGGSPTHLETFEDGSLDASLQGIGGSIISVSFGGIRDSVDSDDGQVDGTCGPQTAGRCASWFGNGVPGVGFSFVGSGALPTAFGLVWTDGFGTITFSAKGADGQSLGSFSFNGIPDGSAAGTTAEDRFFGLQFAGGIQSIHISNSSGGIEVDHIQYGQMAPVPEPAAWALMAAGLLGIAGLRRRAIRARR